MQQSEKKPTHQTCHRCYIREYIPTHQLVKFDADVHYLCLKCWEAFRAWFHWGRRTVSEPTADR